MYFVYILYSEKLDKYYKGYTNNVEERLMRHNKGYETYTSKGTPWKLKLVLQKSTEREAIRLEKKLKNLNKKQLEEFIAKYGGSNQDDWYLDADRSVCTRSSTQDENKVLSWYRP